MSLIPALIRGMAHNRAERERLNKRGKDPYGLDIGEEALHRDALEWATTRGSRSGRTAWQYITDLAGRLEKRLS